MKREECLIDFARFPAVTADRLSDSPRRFYNLRFELWPLAACLVLGGWFVLRIFWM